MHDRIAHNVSTIRERIHRAATRVGRSPESVTLVAVTKTVGVPEILTLYDLGIRDFGENRLEDAREKIRLCPGDIRWHHLAPVQSRKARDVVALFSSADAVDRLKIAEALQQRCDEQQNNLDILVETNISGELSKHGFSPTEVGDAVRTMALLERIHVRGLMTMAPFDAPEEELRACFGGLNRIADTLGLPERSMGMTDDFEIAVEEGSTQVRIGRALFL